MARYVSKQLENSLGEPFSILIPWVYGKDQLRILQEEVPFESELRNKVFLSVELGDVLRPLLFSGGQFNEELITFLQIYKKQKQRIEYLLKKKIPVTDLNGVVSQIDSSNIRLEVSRNPVLSSGIEHSYYSSISYCSSILEEFLEFEDADNIDCTLIEKATLVIREIEEGFRLHFQPVPRCLSFKKNYKPLFETERETPPLIHLPKVPIEKIGRGIFIKKTLTQTEDVLYAAP